MEYKESNFSGKYFPPFHKIFVQKIPIQNDSGQNVFICQPIIKISAEHFARN